MSVVVTSISNFISTVFSSAGNIVTTEVTIAFQVPRIDQDTTVVNGKTLADAFAALTSLTIGNGSIRTVIENYAFSGSPFIFPNLKALTFNGGIQIGTAIFGSNSGLASSVGVSFPQLKIIIFNANCQIAGSELFGAYNKTPASLPMLETIIINGNTTFTGDNVFGIFGGSTSVNFPQLTQLNFQSTSSTPINIRSNQFFGSASSSPNVSCPALTNLLITNGTFIFGGNTFAYSNFPNLALLSFETGVMIQGTNTFLNTVVSNNPQQEKIDGTTNEVYGTEILPLFPSLTERQRS